jgi:hypothetical protein
LWAGSGMVFRWNKREVWFTVKYRLPPSCRNWQVQTFNFSI